MLWPTLLAAFGWWIHVDIWQNQYNIVKLKNKINKLKNFKKYLWESSDSAT